MSKYCYVMEKEKQFMFEFFSLLNNMQNIQNFTTRRMNDGVELDNQVAEAYYKLYEINQRINSDTAIFFVPSEGRKINLFYWIFAENIEKYSSCEDLIKEIDKWEPINLAYRAMKFHDMYNNFSDSFYREIVNSKDLFMGYMNGLNTSTEVRWNIMTFIQQPEETVKALKKYITKMYEAFTYEYNQLNKQRNALNELIESSIEKNLIDSAILEAESDICQENFKNNTSRNDFSLSVREIKVVGLLFTPAQIIKFNSINGTYYGIGNGFVEEYNLYQDELITERQLGEMFKAFTDGTRAQIIEILKNKECYNGELSRMIDVPMSSLTHHMEILNNSGFVIKKNIGKRTYYKLNKNQFLKASAMLRKYIEDYDL